MCTWVGLGWNSLVWVGGSANSHVRHVYPPKNIGCPPGILPYFTKQLPFLLCITNFEGVFGNIHISCSKIWSCPSFNTYPQWSEISHPLLILIFSVISTSNSTPKTVFATFLGISQMFCWHYDSPCMPWINNHHEYISQWIYIVFYNLIL